MNTRAIVSLLASGLVLSACSGSDAGHVIAASSESPAAVVTEASSPTPTPTPSVSALPSPTADAGESLPDGVGLISSLGVDRFALGADIASLAAAGDLAPEGTCPTTFFESAGVHMAIRSDGGPAMGSVAAVYLFVWGAEEVSSSDPAIATAEGIALGSTLDELIAAYPTGHLVEHQIDDDLKDAYVADIDGMPIAFQLRDSDRVVREIGVNTDHLDSEYCG